MRTPSFWILWISIGLSDDGMFFLATMLHIFRDVKGSQWSVEGNKFSTFLFLSLALEQHFLEMMCRYCLSGELFSLLCVAEAHLWVMVALTIVYWVDILTLKQSQLNCIVRWYSWKLLVVIDSPLEWTWGVLCMASSLVVCMPSAWNI